MKAGPKIGWRQGDITDDNNSIYLHISFVLDVVWLHNNYRIRVPLVILVNPCLWFVLASWFFLLLHGVVVKVRFRQHVKHPILFIPRTFGLIFLSRVCVCKGEGGNFQSTYMVPCNKLSWMCHRHPQVRNIFVFMCWRTMAMPRVSSMASLHSCLKVSRQSEPSRDQHTTKRHGWMGHEQKKNTFSLHSSPVPLYHG